MIQGRRVLRRFSHLVNQTGEKQIPVFLHFQDLSEEAAFTAPVNWCRIKRGAGFGKFINHSRAFKLAKPKAVSKLANPAIQVRDTSNVVDETVMLAFVENEEWARQIVYRWNRRTANRQHKASLRKYQAMTA